MGIRTSKLLFLLSEKDIIGGAKPNYIKCPECNTCNDVYHDFGRLIFLGFIPTSISWEIFRCKKCSKNLKINLKFPKKIKKQRSVS